MADFHGLADNLRESFRALAESKPRGSVVELPGVSIASLGVTFQMFNAAFPSQLIETQSELQQRLEIARDYFRNLNMRWSFWCCEDWLAPSVRRRLSRTCETYSLRLSSDMPGMQAENILPAKQKLPVLDVRPVRSLETLNDFRGIGSNCFHVPISWFSEVFDESVAERQRFLCWVAYVDGNPVSTAASVTSHGLVGIYNVATSPQWRGRGYAEAITRHTIAEALRATEADSIVLQSTSLGYPIYERMGFKAISRILVYNSFP